jgi:trans-2,3-dihydro-3-hydroxyanthranilate isomerase
MQRRYITVDVFTDRAFGGNPLAVVLDAGGLSTAQMQAIASEFNYSETTFVLPPRDGAHDAQVRIFTVNNEIPFAGHPNVGTAFVLATQAAKPPARLKFEEGAGLVPVDILQEEGRAIGAELTAPQRLSRLTQFSAAQAAACLSLPEGEIRTDRHPPQIAHRAGRRHGTAKPAADPRAEGERRCRLSARRRTLRPDDGRHVSAGG